MSDTIPDTIPKPPLGLMPRGIWFDQRISDVLDAMDRYAEVNKPIPKHWVWELRWLLSSGVVKGARGYERALRHNGSEYQPGPFDIAS